MKRKTIKALLLSMALCVVTAFSAGTALLQANAATADELNADNFKVLGASIRLKDENDTTGDGIRFAIGVEKNVYEANADIKNNVRVLIMPTQLVSGELTIDEKYQPEGSEAYAEPADEKTSGVWTLKTMNVDGEEAEYYCTFAYMWNIPDNFYNVNLTARAYYTEDNGETASVYSTEAVRSFEYVADAALDDLKAEQETGEDAKYVNPVTVGDTTMYSPYSDTQRTNIAKYLTDYTVTFKDGLGNTTTETVKYGTAVAMPEETPDCKGDFLYWQKGNEKYDFDTEVTSNITISAKQSVATTGANTLVSEQTISGDFRAEFFVGKDSLNFDYNETKKEHFGVQVVFKTADESKSAQFQLLRYDNRIQFKHYNGSGDGGSATTFMTLGSGSTTDSPKYTMTNDYAAAIGASLVEKDGITMVVERKGSAWDMYIKVADVYYIIKENITLNNLGSDAIAKIMLQSSNADNTNNAYVKGFTVVNNPSAITKIGYKDYTDDSANGGATLSVAKGSFGTKFRVETFIGLQTLDLTYDANAPTNTNLWGIQIVCRSDDGQNKKQSFSLYRWGNRIICLDANQKFSKEYTLAEAGGYKLSTKNPFSETAMKVISKEIEEKKGITYVIERDGAKWSLWVKVADDYYFIGEKTESSVAANVGIGSIELYGLNGVSSTNKAVMNNTVVTINPTDTITAVE
jgi:hypothetical protein